MLKTITKISIRYSGQRCRRVATIGPPKERAFGGLFGAAGTSSVSSRGRLVGISMAISSGAELAEQREPLRPGAEVGGRVDVTQRAEHLEPRAPGEGELRGAGEGDVF